MSVNKKAYTEFDKFDKAKDVHESPIYRRREVYLSKEQVIKLRDLKKKVK